MSVVSDEFIVRWSSGAHTATRFGDWRPSQRVFVRRGEYRRGYQPWDGATVNADITGESRARPWSSTWHAFGDWMEVPGVSAISLDQDFDSNGTTTGTVTIENILYREHSGVMGQLYHTIERGALTPLRGYKAPGMGALKPPARNEWFGVLGENAMIKILQGYGDELVPTFIGFIDKVTPGASPDNLVLSMRCVAGKVLNDEHMFGWNVSKQLPQPVVFRAGPKGKRVGNAPAASSSRKGTPPRSVADDSTKTVWVSADQVTANDTEWIEIRLPRGRYASFILHPAFKGMEVYVGLYARPRLGTIAGGAAYLAPQLDGEDIDPGWQGTSTVPGASDGGWQFIRKYASHADEQRIHDLPGTFHVGDNSILRIGFRRLHKVKTGVYQAGAIRLQAIQVPVTKPKTKKEKVIVVQDAADIVRVVLRWAGFKDWKVDDTGVGLDDEFKVNKESTYMDVIAKVLEVVGAFVFYVEAPLGDDQDPDSLGVPVFREAQVLKDNVPNTRVVRDRDLLTDVNVNFTDDPKAYIIRYRGRVAPKKGLTIGKTPALDDVRLMAVYRPPWSRNRRMGRIIRRHFIHTERLIKTQAECEIAARLVALKQALEGATAQIDIPGTPEMDLDAQIAVADAATGIATRLYIVRRSSEATYGQRAKWMTSIGGSLIDHIDVVQVKADLAKVVKK